MTTALPTVLLIHTVTWIVPSTSTDVYGNTVRSYTAPAATSTSITGRMEQNAGTEPLVEGRDPLERRWTLFTNQAGISGYDRIVFDGLTFEVEGPPSPAYGAGAFHHAEVGLRRVDG